MSDSGEEREAPVETPVEAPGEAPTPRRRRRGWLVLLALLVLVAVAFGAVSLLAPQYLPPQLRLPAGIKPQGNTVPIAAGSTAPSQFEALEQRIVRLQDHVGELQRKLAHLEQQAQSSQALAERLQQLEQKLAALPKTAPPVGASASDLAALAQRLGALEQKQATPPPANPEQQRELAALHQTLGGLEQRLKTTQDEIQQLNVDKLATSKQMALVLAVQRLAAAAAGSASFADALRPVQSLAQGGEAEAAVKTLQGLQDGVPSLPALQTSFGRDVADRIVRAGKVSTDASWWQKTWERITAPVVIRRTGEVTGSAPDAVVARAEQRLAHGNLQAAVQEIAALQGESGKAAADWLAAARNRLAVDSAIASLQTTALAQLTQPAKDGK